MYKACWVVNQVSIISRKWSLCSEWILRNSLSRSKVQVSQTCPHIYIIIKLVKYGKSQKYSSGQVSSSSDMHFLNDWHNLMPKSLAKYIWKKQRLEWGLVLNIWKSSWKLSDNGRWLLIQIHISLFCVFYIVFGNHKIFNRLWNNHVILSP